MNPCARCSLFVVSLAAICLSTTFVNGQISNFQHIIIVVQENRTPDNLFQGLCSPPYGTSASCSTKPTGSQYDIQTSNWLDKTSPTGTTQPTSGPLGGSFDLGHKHVSFTTMCDVNSAGVCRMDAAANNTCYGTCPTKPAFQYADNSTGLLDPYLDLATQYGWGNYMFQTNQGPSFPAHQFLFGGTSAPNAADDAIGTFAAENVTPLSSSNTFAGCIAALGTYVNLITTAGETQKMYPCFDYTTLSDLLDAEGVTWKYYAPGPGTIWTAPNAINHICQPNASTNGQCVGPEWTSNVVLTPLQFLRDVSQCKLADVVWVIPEGAFSDHPRSNNGDGPSWVASVVNAIGNNRKCKDGELYWDNTAMLITWDDWGGWYDHEAPTILPPPQGDYQYGFRVPFIAVSAYTNAGYVDNTRYDFGSILRFIEQNYGIAEGALNFADSRSTTDLKSFFNLNQAPRVFTTIPSRRDVNSFINDTSPMTDPDDY